MSHLCLLLVDDLIHIFDETDRVTVISPINIAITKYWGKRDFDLNIPLNDSISMTLSMQSMCTKTTITIYRGQCGKNEHRISLNGERPKAFNARIKRMIDAISSMNNSILSDLIFIKSTNDFPTAAGLASSASGFCAIAFALCHLYGISQKSIISSIARCGSGSASRSVFGGFVKWQTLKNESCAHQMFDCLHWSELCVIVCIVSCKEKEIGSTEAQILSTQTSNLLKYRIQNMQKTNENLLNAIRSKSFDNFAQIMMRESNQFHAICLDTFPPIFYLNETSKQIIKICHLLNAHFNEIMLGYTFDAGPNAVIVCKNSLALSRTVNVIQTSFKCNDEFVEDTFNLCQSDVQMNGFNAPNYEKSQIEKIVVTKLGKGPQIIHSKVQRHKGQ